MKDEVNNVRYQVKSRRVSSNNRIQLGVIRNYEEVEFDYLIAMIFNEDFTLREVYKIPHAVIVEYGKFREHQNGIVLMLANKLKNDPRVEGLLDAFIG